MNAYYGLYTVCIRLKDRAAAQDHMTRYRELKAKHKEAARRINETLPSDIDCFYQSLGNALAAGYRELSRLYVRMKKNLPKAREFAQKVVNTEPEAPAYYDLALACFVNQDLEAAVSSMEKAVQLDSRDPKYGKMLALFKQKKGDVK
jgi:tetratricopeptide (TPR) repeat protein